VHVAEEYSYRFASAVLADPSFAGVLDELKAIISRARVPLLSPSIAARKNKMKQRSVKATKKDPRPRFLLFPVKQAELNASIDREFARSKSIPPWEYHPRAIPEGLGIASDPKVAADCRRLRVQVEVQFGNAARWYADVFKFQLSYSLNVIDAAVLVVPTQKLANFIDDNISYFERVVRELPSAKLSLTLPILVLGVEPDNWNELKSCYDDASERRELASAAKGKPTARIPFAVRIRDEINVVEV